MPSITLPQLPVRHADLIQHIAKHPDAPLRELIKPFRDYEATLRQAYAQDPDAEMLKDPHVNVLPLFTGGKADVKIRARDLDDESEDENSKYIMPLSDEVRRPDGSPAVVPSFKELGRK